MLDDIRTKEDVLAQHSQDDWIVGLDTTVAETHSITAEHYQIAPDVVARMLEQVMQGELVLGLQAERAFTPFEMELFE